MSKKTEPARPEARLPKGFSDISASEIRASEQMLGTIRGVFESYGFEPLDTPAIEYSDALGKFLPDQDRPNEGVFSFQDDDDQWLSLRYDLTAPLARYVAENYQNLPRPFRRYQVGPVWRNEKPGPGRFRQFAVEEGDPISDAASVTQGRLPIPRRERVTSRRVVLKATLIPFNPGEHRIRATQSKQGLGRHRAMVGVATDQIWAGTMQDVQYFVDSSRHSTCSLCLQYNSRSIEILRPL